VQDVKRQVSENWGKLESVVDERVAQTLNGLGIPSTDDISKLAAQLQKLSVQVDALEKQIKVSAKATPKKAATPKAATSMTVTEKPVAAKNVSKKAAVKKAPAPKPATTS